MSFRITGPGLYRTRDGRKAEVKESYPTETGNTIWLGCIGDIKLSWDENGMFRKHTSPYDLITPWEEPVAPQWDRKHEIPNHVVTSPPPPPPTPYHRTEVFRAETARMLFVDMMRTENNSPMSSIARVSVEAAEKLIAALDKPQTPTP